jgi:hypothetical protein
MGVRHAEREQPVRLPDPQHHAGERPSLAG